MNLRTIFWKWLPLAISFELMMLEGPTIQRAIGSLANPVLNLAGFGLAFQIALLIESPVLMLLATAIALVSDSRSHRAMRRFTVNTAIFCTAMSALIAFTPVYGVLTRAVMHQPQEIALAAHPALRIMLLWAAAIAWRRFLQGILVRFGQTQWVTCGTVMRIAAIVTTAWTLGRAGTLSGAEVGACAAMAGVVVEAAATSLFAIPSIRRLRVSAPSNAAEGTTQAAIFRFHAPLAVTTLLTLLVGPLSSAALAVLSEPRRTLAATPVVVALMMALRGWGFAIQEISVALAAEEGAQAALGRFAWVVGWVTTAAAALVAYTPLIGLYARFVVHAPENIAGLIRVGTCAAAGLPLATALVSWKRGLLVSAARTSAVYRGMGINLACHAAVLSVGVAMRMPGVPLAFVSVTAASVVELFYLWRKAAEPAASEREVLQVPLQEAASFAE